MRYGKILCIILLIILMITLADLGYDQYFRRPLPQEYQLYSAVNYDSMLEDNSVIESKIADGSITDAKIKNVSWDKGKGGELELGGGNNISGILSLKDETNTEKIRLDKDGMMINDGKMIIKNNTNQVVIDSYGLNSGSNFNSFDVKLANLNQVVTTAEPDWTDLTGTSSTFVLKRTTLVLFNLKTTFWGGGGGSTAADALIRIIIDGKSSNTHRIEFRNPTAITSGSTHRVERLAPGTHTVKIEATINRDTGSPTLTMNAVYFSYIVFGT